MEPFEALDLFEVLKYVPESQKHAEVVEYSESMSDILDNLGRVLGHLKKCILSHDQHVLEEAEKELSKGLKASLPMAEKAIRKREKTAQDKQFLECVPILQRVGIAADDLLNAVKIKIKTETAFTDKALKEVGEIMGLTRSLARDTRDVLFTKNPDFKGYVAEAAKSIHGIINECDLVHQDRLINGVCSPKASFLYLDIMTSLKRIVNELLSLSEKV